MEIIKQILELKITITEFKNSLEGVNSRFKNVEERIIKLKERSFKIIKFEEQKEEKIEEKWTEFKELIGYH